MRLFIMRHGEAVDRAESDAARPLSSAGHHEVVTMAQSHGDKLVAIDDIWASPYLRAQQTAVLMARHLGKPVTTQPWLRPAEDYQRVLAALGKAEGTVLLVSHQPLVGTLVDKLAGLEAERCFMGTGDIACLETDVLAIGCAELCWLHQSRQ